MRRMLGAAAVVLVCALSGSALQAQASALPVADAAKFMGTWTLTLDSPMGPFALNASFTDAEGKVACELTSDVFPPQKVTDITKAANDLVLKYQGDFQGQAFAAKVTLTPLEEGKVGVSFDIADGQFMMSGVGVKK